MSYLKGAMLGGILGAAASIMLINYYEPRTARVLMRKGQGALRHASRHMMKHW